MEKGPDCDLSNSKSKVTNAEIITSQTGLLG
jgi:hypothetical protein